MGSRRFFLAEGPTIRAEAPLTAHRKLIRNGKLVADATRRTLDVPLARPGNHRVKAWLEVAGEDMIWILSNPIYIRSR
jgi:hypothetical protein